MSTSLILSNYNRLKSTGKVTPTRSQDRYFNILPLPIDFQKLAMTA